MALALIAIGVGPRCSPISVKLWPLCASCWLRYGWACYARQIPRDLITALKKQVTVDSAGDKTDVELLFQEGDVVSCRINSFSGPKKLDMSMLPPKDEEDDDDYVVDGRDPEDEGQSGRPRRSSRFAETNIDSESINVFDGESKLLWWRGQPYTPLGRPEASEDVEIAVVQESSDVVEGVWRRMFEVDLREDAADFSSKIEEAELKELQNDIGELMGLDDDMFSMADFNMMSTGPMNVGGHNMGLLEQLPDDWKSEMTFFKELSNTASSLDAMYRGGKASEQQEFDALIREVETEINANKKSMPDIEDVPEVAPEAVSAETSTAVEQEASPEAAEEPAAEAPAEGVISREIFFSLTRRLSQVCLRLIFVSLCLYDSCKLKFKLYGKRTGSMATLLPTRLVRSARNESRWRYSHSLVR